MLESSSNHEDASQEVWESGGQRSVIKKRGGEVDGRCFLYNMMFHDSQKWLCFDDGPILQRNANVLVVARTCSFH
jgi:hypothetical protein